VLEGWITSPWVRENRVVGGYIKGRERDLEYVKCAKVILKLQLAGLVLDYTISLQTAVE
jgi:hypothetical protein